MQKCNLGPGFWNCNLYMGLHAQCGTSHVPWGRSGARPSRPSSRLPSNVYALTPGARLCVAELQTELGGQQSVTRQSEGGEQTQTLPWGPGRREAHQLGPNWGEEQGAEREGGEIIICKQLGFTGTGKSKSHPQGWRTGCPSWVKKK